jgi:hypothetical protein
MSFAEATIGPCAPATLANMINAAKQRIRIS